MARLAMGHLAYGTAGGVTADRRVGSGQPARDASIYEAVTSRGSRYAVGDERFVSAADADAPWETQ